MPQFEASELQASILKEFVFSQLVVRDGTEVPQTELFDL